MKKIVGTIAAIALAASSAFAGVNVGMGFNRGFFTPFAMVQGDNQYIDVSTSWGAAPRIGASFSASSENFGVAADVKFDGGNVAVNDNAYIWCKPVDFLKFTVGQTFDDTLRGNAAFGSWDWLRPGNILGEDLIFTRICSNPLSGAYAPVQGTIIMLDPIEGLHIAAAFNIADYKATAADVVFSKIQVQAGYTIADVAQIKAQWIGAGTDADNKAQGVIEAAVSLKAVENMTLDVGAAFATVKDSDISIKAFWSMPVGPVALSVNGKVDIPTVSKGTTNVAAGAGLGFDLGNGVGCGADVRYSQSFNEVKNSDAAIAFAAWLTKDLANGNIGVAFQGASKTGIRDFAASDFTLAVPVRVQCFF